MPATETLRAFPFARPGHGRSDVEGEQDSTAQEAEEQQGQPEEQAQPQGQQAQQVDGTPDYQELLDRQDARIAGLVVCVN